MSQTYPPGKCRYQSVADSVLKRKRKPFEPQDIFVWAYGEQFERMTGLNLGTLYRSRVNHAPLPVAGQRMRYRIHQAGPGGYLRAPLPTSKLPKKQALDSALAEQPQQ